MKRLLSLLALVACNTSNPQVNIVTEASMSTPVDASPPVDSSDVAVVDAAPPGRPPLPRGSTVLLIGDSQAVGMGAYFRKTMSACGYRPVEHTKGGTNTFQWIDWVGSDLRQYSPDLVVIVLGTNDACQLKRALAGDSYHKLVSKLGDRRYLWVLPPDVSPKRVPNIRETHTFIAESLNSTFDSVAHNVPVSSDLIHSTADGYSYWMSEIWDHLVENRFVEECLTKDDAGR